MRFAIIDQTVPGASPANVLNVVETAGNPPSVQPGQGSVCDPPPEVAAGWVLVAGRFSATLPVQTVFDPRTLITTLFTPAEQLGFTAKPEGILFATLIASTPAVDITSAAFKAYIAQAVAGGFLTQARADQVLAGTPAPQGS